VELSLLDFLLIESAGKFFEQSVLYQFLHTIAECFACLSHGLGVCLFVHLFVRHTLDLYENGAS